MMTILSRVCVSGGDDVIIPTIELSCPAWADYPGAVEGSLFICDGYEDHEITTEDDRTVTARATGLAVALPKRDATGAQNLIFAVNNLYGEVAELKRLAIDSGGDIALTFRTYLLSDLSHPAETPLYLVVRGIDTENGQATITAGLFDLIDTKWPRRVFNSENAPAAGYM